MKLKKIKTRVVSLLTAFMCVFTFSVQMFAISASADEYNNKAEKGTVAVTFNFKNGQYIAGVGEKNGKLMYKPLTNEMSEFQYSGGSGFFINDQNIVTNCHVVVDYIETNEGDRPIIATGQYAESKDGNKYPVYVRGDSCELRVYYDEKNYDVAHIKCYGEVEKVDLAVLNINKPTDKRLSLKIKPVKPSMKGSEIYTVGFPGNSDNKFVASSKYGIGDCTVRKGVIERIGQNDKGVERVGVDATIQHGNSGGPLVNAKGEVLGVDTNVYSTQPYEAQIEADYYAISSNQLMDFLVQNNIEFTKASALGVGGIIAIIAGVLVIAGLVVVFIILKKKGKFSKTAKANKPQKVNKNAAGSGELKAVIRSMSAQHNGKAFPVGKAPVMIGRDASNCVIVFKEGTPGVSGKHCTVSFDSATGVFTLTDLRSSYGTFILSTGQKLSPNVPVKITAGTSFYVGDKANILSVELEK